jgi:hypothetical protein
MSTDVNFGGSGNKPIPHTTLNDAQRVLADTGEDGTTTSTKKVKITDDLQPLEIDALQPSGIQPDPATSNDLLQAKVILPSPTADSADPPSAGGANKWFSGVCYQLVLVQLKNEIIQTSQQAKLVDVHQCVQDITSETQVAQQIAQSQLQTGQLQSQELMMQGEMLIVSGALTLAGGVTSIASSGKNTSQASMQKASGISKSFEAAGQMVQGISKILEAGYKIPEAVQEGLQTILQTANKIRDKKWDNDVSDWKSNQQAIDQIISDIQQILKSNSDAFTYRGGFTS